MQQLTERQERVYYFIINFIKENGYSPTVREICKGLGMTSTASVFNFLQILKRKEYIDYIPNKPRTIIIK